MCPLSNELIPIPLNYDTAMSGGNGVLVQESQVSAVSGVSYVSPKERVVWLQMRRKNRHKSPFFSIKNPRKKSNAGFSISICSITNQNHPTPLRTDTFKVVGNTPDAEVT